jgi:hypothetical protein
MVQTNYNNSKFMFVYGSHIVICFLLAYGWIFRNKLWLEFLIMASIYIQTMYGLFNGCICTRLERKYNKWRKDNRSTIVDPILKFFNIERKRSNIDYVTGLVVNIGLITAIIHRYIFF